MSDPVWCWWLDDRGNPWVKHECRFGDWELMAWRLPPPWRVEGEGIVPSLNCSRCGAHQFIGPVERWPFRLWNWEIGEDDVCPAAGELYGWGAPVFVLDDGAKVGVSSWSYEASDAEGVGWWVVAVPSVSCAAGWDAGSADPVGFETVRWPDGVR